MACCAAYTDTHRRTRAHRVSSVHARARPEGKKAKYLPAYTARAILLVSMHRAGVGRLGGTGQISVEEFASAFPDERRWFVRLCSSSDRTATTVEKFFSDLGYKGRPEFWSMFSCLLLTRSMWLSDAWLSHHCASLRKAMRSQHHHRIMRLPALCVQDVLSKDKP